MIVRILSGSVAYPYLVNTKLNYMANLIDLTGNTYGRLTVTKFIGRKNCHSFWQCVCDCGNETEATSNQLRTGNKKSCGCLMIDVNRERQLSHGESKNLTKEYRTWCRIRSRCYNKNNIKFSSYGGRGITVCDRWMDSYENFLYDMGRAPSPSHSIDRKDNNGNYEPSNCRWATIIEQANNKSNNILIDFNGGMITLKQYCRVNNLEYNTILYRAHAGLPITTETKEQ